MKPQSSHAVMASGNTTERLKPILEARGLDAGYGGIPMVRNLSLHVSPGEVVALLGANGAGKTTALQSLAGWLKPLGGEVLFEGRPTHQFLDQRAKAGTALITEGGGVIAGLTTEANLKLGKADIQLALELFPELNRLMKRKAGLLSGGEQRILTLARALARRPKLLLADELSLGLAPKVVARLLSAVRQAADEGLAVLLVEQHARLALEVADRGYVLQRGVVVIEGTAAQVLDRYEDIRDAYVSGNKEEK